jgi:Bacteriophage Lambda NinG protein
MKKTKRARLEKKIDDIFSLYIRARDNYRCICCGANEHIQVIQCGHLITRSRRVVRWDEKNADAQCRPCNLIHEYNPEIYTKLWIEKYGLKAYNELVEKSWKSIKYSLQELEDILLYYKKKLTKVK